MAENTEPIDDANLSRAETDLLARIKGMDLFALFKLCRSFIARIRQEQEIARTLAEELDDLRQILSDDVEDRDGSVEVVELARTKMAELIRLRQQCRDSERDCSRLSLVK